MVTAIRKAKHQTYFRISVNSSSTNRHRRWSTSVKESNTFFFSVIRNDSWIKTTRSANWMAENLLGFLRSRSGENLRILRFQSFCYFSDQLCFNFPLLVLHHRLAFFCFTEVKSNWTKSNTLHISCYFSRTQTWFNHTISFFSCYLFLAFALQI